MIYRKENEYKKLLQFIHLLNYARNGRIFDATFPAPIKYCGVIDC